MNNEIKSYRDLIVWQKAMDLTIVLYKLTKSFPKEESYGLTSQIKRSVVSIPSNIAEGYNRGTRKDYRHFLIIAYGSGAELETQIEIAKRVFNNLNLYFNEVDQLLNEVMKMLNVLIGKLKNE